MKNFILVFVSLILASCQTREKVDAIVINANAYTVNENFDTAESIAVKDGKIIYLGSNDEVFETYGSENIIDARGQTIVPGFIDAHCHFLGLGANQQAVDLVGTTSFEEVMKRVLDFQNEKHEDFILGRGWDQNDWDEKIFPDNILLNKLFPNIPVVLTRVDGHAILCNDAALALGKVNGTSKIDGGEVIVKNGKPTGILIDNAENLVMNFWPKQTRAEKVQALLDAQKMCFDLGLTTVDDAGLDIETIEIIDSLHHTGDLKMRIYAMVSASKKNLDYYLNKGIVKTERLNVRSFKVYADGALGSRGALLRKPYSDKHDHFGLLLTRIEDLENTADRISNSEFQMNTHAIGDSANHTVLQTYKKVLNGKSNRRWRIEHAQIVSPEDFKLFDNIIPSIQPTHATSDMYWAEDRLGKERVNGAYAYKKLLNVNGRVALGTDFPVEYVSPFYTFYAAVARQDLKQYPAEGFQIENGLSREETLKGMTIWAAYSNFEEDEKGSLEVGKFADFIILDKDIMTVSLDEIPNIKVNSTYVNGELQ